MRIFIADDCRDTGASLAQRLEAVAEEPAATLVALDGARAVEPAQAAPPDVVVLDITMPDIDGYMAAHRMHTGSFWSRCLASPSTYLRHAAAAT